MSVSTPITVSVSAPAGLRVAHHDRHRGRSPVLDVEAVQLEVGGSAEVPVVAARGDRAVDDGEARALASGLPDVAVASRSRAPVPRGRTSCAPRNGVVEPADRVGLDGRPAPACRASSGKHDWLPTTVKSAASQPGGCGSRPRMSSIGAAAAVLGAHVEAAAEALDVVDARMNEPDEVVPVDEREDDEGEHRERHAGAEAVAQRVGHRHPQDRREGADPAEDAHRDARAGRSAL